MRGPHAGRVVAAVTEEHFLGHPLAALELIRQLRGARTLSPFTRYMPYPSG